LDSVTAYQWSGPGIITSFGETIDVNEPGWYHLSAFGVNGCPAEHDILVDSNFIQPAYTLTSDSLRCDIPADLVVTPVDSVLRYSWFDPAGILISSDSFVIVNQAGSYTVEIQGLNQCISFDTVILEPVQYPLISIGSDTITCSSPTATVMVDVDIPQYSLAWIDIQNDTISVAGSLNVSDEGPFIASVSGLNACETRDTILVPFDTISPQAVITLIGKIKCKNRDVVLDAIASTPDPLLYSWTTIGGQILSDPTLDQINVRDTGDYYLTLQHPRNGCMDSAEIYLAEDPDAITLAYLDVMPPQCSGDEDASIQVTGLEGGVGPFQYQLDGSPFQSNPVFDELVAGSYLLTISDNDDCTFDTTVVIDPTLDFSVDAGPDMEIYLGETAELSGMTNLAQTDVMTDSWSSSEGLLCSDCAQFGVNPSETASFTYQVTSLTGCVKEDELMVYVVEKGKYYLPNIFSPNGDDINDKIRIIASPGIERILQWVIFDRWGNAAYGKTDFDPNDLEVFWNGQTSTGEFVNPGVFPYVLEIQLINGKIEVHHGDITVIR
jgi:hypothetical protein